LGLLFLSVRKKNIFERYSSSFQQHSELWRRQGKQHRVLLGGLERLEQQE
jgi:hypothetical protein